MFSKKVRQKMSVLIKGITLEQFYRDLNNARDMDAGWDIVQLSADVREVVTCSECKYADNFTPTCTEATFPLKCLSIRYGGVYPNWFCEHGERK